MTNDAFNFNPSESTTLVPLSELCVAYTGLVDPTQTPNTSFRYVDISSVDNRRKSIVESKTIVGKEAPSRARQMIRANDVLVATTCPNLNAVAIVPPELDGSICSTGFCVLRSNGRVVPEYLFAFVQTGQFIRSLSDLVKGALYPAVTDNQVKSQRLPLHGLATQERIAARLREQLAEVERARAAVEEQLKTAEALPATFLRAVFSSPAAQHWPRNRLAECCELLPSKSIALAGDTEVHAITSACLTEWVFRADGIKSARMWAADAKMAVAKAGEILIARSNTTELVGRAAIFPGGAISVVASDLTIRLWPNASTAGEFLAFFLSALFVSGYWRDRAGGASGSMKKITRTQIANLPIPCPGLSEQQRIAAKMKTEFREAPTLREQLAQKRAAVEKISAALLREAFSGRV